MNIQLGKKADVKQIKGFQKQFLSYGIHLVSFQKMELKEARTGKLKLVCYLEGQPLGGDFEGFKEQDGTIHKGLIARADLGIYFEREDPSKMLSNLTALASELGFTDEEMAGIKAETLENFLNEYVKMIKGSYTWVMLKAEEYENNKGKINLNLAIYEEYAGKDSETGGPIFQIFCKKEDFKESTADDSDGNTILLVGFDKAGEFIGRKKTMNFDKTSDYHYKAIDQPDQESDDEDEMDDVANVDDSF